MIHNLAPLRKCRTAVDERGSDQPVQSGKRLVSHRRRSSFFVALQRAVGGAVVFMVVAVIGMVVGHAVVDIDLAVVAGQRVMHAVCRLGVVVRAHGSTPIR